MSRGGCICEAQGIVSLFKARTSLMNLSMAIGGEGYRFVMPV